MRATPPAVGSGDDRIGPPTRPALSIISPVYLGAESVHALVAEIIAATEQVTADFEIVLVEDRSPDGSWDAITVAAAADERVKGVRLSRNFGQHNAILAGLDLASGDRVVILDCDLQDDPAYIPEMWAAMVEGVDVVLTRKVGRRHKTTRNLTGGAYARFTRLLAGAGTLEHSDRIGNYMMLSRQAVDALRSLGDAHPHLLVSLAYVGFERAIVDIEHRERAHGESSYTFGRLIRLAVADTALQSKRLLYFSVATGIGFMVAAALAIVTLVVLWATRGFLEGWTSMMCLVLLSTGLILFCLGVLGLYLGAVLDETRARPAYVIGESRNIGPAGHATSPTDSVDPPRR